MWVHNFVLVSEHSDWILFGDTKQTWDNPAEVAMDGRTHTR